MVRSLALPLALALAVSAVAPARSAPPRPAPCVDIAASPAFAQDGTVFCLGDVVDTDSQEVTGIALWVSTDKGRSWREAGAGGLPPGTGSTSFRRDLFVSPVFGIDHTVFVQLEKGLYASTDNGATFLLVDPLGGYGRLTPFVASVDPGPLPLDTRRAWLALARRGAAEGANESALIDPVTRLRTVVKGTPGLDTEFVIPSNFAEAGTAYAVAEHGVGLTRKFQLYRCNAVLTCNDPLFSFPNRWSFDRIWLAPDFATSQTLFASTTAFDVEGRVLWVSRNGGVTFERWTAAQRLLGAFRLAPEFGIAGVPGTKTMYLRTSTNWSVGRKSSDATAEQLFVSTDLGRRWRRVSWGRGPLEKPPRGPMPYLGLGVALNGGHPRGLVVAPEAGRVFSAGRSFSERADTVYCTADGGKSWAHGCKK